MQNWDWGVGGSSEDDNGRWGSLFYAEIRDRSQEANGNTGEKGEARTTRLVVALEPSSKLGWEGCRRNAAKMP